LGLFRHWLEQHLLHEPRHGRGGGEAVAVSVEHVHDSGHVEVDSLARRRQRREAQHFVRELLHGAVDGFLQVSDGVCLGGDFRMLQHVDLHARRLPLACFSLNTTGSESTSMAANPYSS